MLLRCDHEPIIVCIYQALGKQLGELTETELRELGLILITLSPEEIGRLFNMDSTTFAVCGSSTLWTKEQVIEPPALSELITLSGGN